MLYSWSDKKYNNIIMYLHTKFMILEPIISIKLEQRSRIEDFNVEETWLRAPL